MASRHCSPPLSYSTPPPPPLSLSLSPTQTTFFFPLFLLSLLYCSKNSTQLSIFWKSTQRQHQSKWHHSKYPNSPLIFIGDSLEVLGICKWVCWFISLKMGSIFYHSFCDEFACDGGCLMVEVGCVVEAVAGCDLGAHHRQIIEILACNKLTKLARLLYYVFASQ